MQTPSMPAHPPLRISPPPVVNPSEMQHAAVADHVRYVPGEVHGAILLQTDRIRQVLFCVAAGHGLPRHQATSDVTVTVMEGTGTLTLDDGAPVRLRPGTHVFMPSGTPHAVTARENLALLATFADAVPEIHFIEPA